MKLQGRKGDNLMRSKEEVIPHTRHVITAQTSSTRLRSQATSMAHAPSGNSSSEGAGVRGEPGREGEEGEEEQVQMNNKIGLHQPRNSGFLTIFPGPTRGLPRFVFPPVNAAHDNCLRSSRNVLILFTKGRSPDIHGKKEDKAFVFEACRREVDSFEVSAAAHFHAHLFILPWYSCVK